MNGLVLLIIIVAALIGGTWAYMVWKLIEYRDMRERRRIEQDKINRYAQAMIDRDKLRGWAADGSGHHGDLTTDFRDMRPGS